MLDAFSDLLEKVPENVKSTWKIRGFSLLKIPLIAFLGPKVEDITDEKISLKIPLGYRSKNHLNSMYFGAMAVGAELSVGLLALKHIENSGKKMPPVFKDFSMEFLKRAEADTFFICEEGDKIEDFVKRVAESDERLNETLNGYALAPDKFGDEPVAKFRLTLSLKAKK